MTHQKIDKRFIPAIDELINHYIDYVGLPVRQVKSYSKKYGGGCPLCDVCEERCSRCPWVIIEDRKCGWHYHPYYWDSAETRIGRLEQWLEIIEKQQAGGKTLQGKF